VLCRRRGIRTRRAERAIPSLTRALEASGSAGERRLVCLVRLNSFAINQPTDRLRDGSLDLVSSGSSGQSWRPEERMQRLSADVAEMEQP